MDLHKRPFYPLDFRVIRFAITESSSECIITNLPQEEFTMNEIKKLYAMRWGIETSFRELKYAIGLACFHSKKVEYIMQEIYARLILYNYCEIITMNVVIHQKDTKHVYQMNYTIAIHICRYFLRNDISPPDVEKLIQKNLLPVRPSQSQTQVSVQFSVSGSLTSTKVYRFFRQMTICLFVLSESRQTIFKTKK